MGVGRRWLWLGSRMAESSHSFPWFGEQVRVNSASVENKSHDALTQSEQFLRKALPMGIGVAQCVLTSGVVSLFARFSTSHEALHFAERHCAEMFNMGASLFAGDSSPTVAVDPMTWSAFVKGEAPRPEEPPYWREVVVVPGYVMPRVLDVIGMSGFPSCMLASARAQSSSVRDAVHHFLTSLVTQVGQVFLVSAGSACLTFRFSDDFAKVERRRIISDVIRFNALHFPSGGGTKLVAREWLKQGVFSFGPT